MAAASESSVSRPIPSSTAGNGITKAEEGPLVLLNSDHPGMVLVTSPLTGSNYLTWSIAIRTSLEAKDKVGFVDGTLEPPTDVDAFRKWKRVDSMIKSWIMNSISKDIADTLIYCASAKKLWDEIEERYGISTGPQLYQIQRSICSVQQGTDSVTVYYSKLHKAWDEMDRLVPLPVCKCTGCTCDVTTKMKELTAWTRLLQFLMGLNHEFDIVRGQLLNLDPLPKVSKAFSMVLHAESQKSVSNSYSSPTVDASALSVRTTNPKSDSDSKSSFKNKPPSKKPDRYCDHCGVTGHTKDACFKLHGYPDWYKELKKNGAPKKSSTAAVNASIVESDGLCSDASPSTDLAAMFSSMFHQEMTKFMRGKAAEDHVNFVTTTDFAGPDE